MTLESKTQARLLYRSKSEIEARAKRKVGERKSGKLGF